MAAIVFPSSPTTNQVYSANGTTWIWDGTSWNAFTPAPSVAWTAGTLDSGNASGSAGKASSTATTAPGIPSPFGSTGAAIVSNGSQWVIQQIIPTGTIHMWATASAPTGFLICNGSAVSRTAYAALFAILGTTFGIGNGSTTFNLPDYRNRMPIGAGSTYSANSQGGATTATLAIANLPAHNHTASVTDPTHSHGTGTTINTGNIPDGLAGGGNYSGVGSGTSGSGTGISVTTQNTGSGTAFDTISPYLGIYFIIKT